MSETKSASKSETWIKLLKEGILKSKTIVVLDYISKFPNTNLYAMRYGLPSMSHQTITSRISNLMDEGVVKITGDAEINDAVYSTYIFVADIEERFYLKKKRAEEKYLGWVKQGLNDHIDFLSTSMKQELKSVTEKPKVVAGDLSTLFNS